MLSRKLHRNISQAYLSFIPLLTALLGFTVNKMRYQIYVPIWVINVFLMLAASRELGARGIRLKNNTTKHIALSGFLLVSPWIFFSIFAGLGAPPGSYAEWVSTAFEQQVRYSFLIAGGVSLILGFAVLREATKNTRGNIFGLIGNTIIAIAILLFILNMSYWHSFLLETFKTAESASQHKLPEWFQPVKKLFLVVSIVEVSLTYLAIAAFAAALKAAGWFKKGASQTYVAISLLAFITVVLYGFYPETVITKGFPFYPLMIPAIPFVLPFYIGVNLLSLAGNSILN